MDDNKRSNRSVPIIAVAAAVLLLLFGAYVGAYFGLSEFALDQSGAPVRIFDSVLKVDFFWPAFLIEKRCRGELWAEWWVGDRTSFQQQVD